MGAAAAADADRRRSSSAASSCSPRSPATLVMRGELRGQVDDQLTRPGRAASSAFGPPAGRGSRSAPGGRRPPRARRRARAAPRRTPSSLGPDGDGARRCAARRALPVTDADRAIAAGDAAARLSDRDAGGDARARAHRAASRGGGAVMLGRALDGRRPRARAAAARARPAVPRRRSALAALLGRARRRPLRRACSTGWRRSQTAQRQLVADASHELRTPVTALRTNAELLLEQEDLAPRARRALLDDVVDQTEELSALVADLIELARGDQPARSCRTCGSTRSSREAVERARRHAPHVAFAADLEPVGGRRRPRPARPRGQQPARQRGEVLAAGRRRSRSRCAAGRSPCATTGRACPPAELPHIFDRFFRAANAREQAGSGLGLAIVKPGRRAPRRQRRGRRGAGRRAGGHAHPPGRAADRTSRDARPDCRGRRHARRLPALPRRLLHQPARRRAAGRARLGRDRALDRPRRRDQGRLRLRPVGGRADRHPLRRRLAAHEAVAGARSTTPDESDRVRYPIPRGVHIEGGPEADGDRHALLVDRDRCKLFELFALRREGGALDARARARRGACAGRSCARRAGRAPTPRASRSCRCSRATRRCKRGRITHALRMTVSQSRRAFVFPARHFASSDDDPALPRMGERLRLKASRRHLRPAAPGARRRPRVQGVRPDRRRQRLGLVRVAARRTALGQRPAPRARAASRAATSRSSRVPEWQSKRDACVSFLEGVRSRANETPPSRFVIQGALPEAPCLAADARPPPLVDARRPLLLAARHRARQHDPQRRAPDAASATSTRAPRSSSGSSTPTCSSSPRLLLTAGALGDRFGRKRALTFGLVVFGLGSASPRSRSSPDMLIATRALMGVGGAFIMPSTLSILTATFPASERAQGDRHLGRGRRARHRHRPGHRRLAPRARRLEPDLPRQRARSSSPRCSPAAGSSPSRATPPRRALDCGGFAPLRLGLAALVWAIIEAPVARLDRRR